MAKDDRDRNRWDEDDRVYGRGRNDANRGVFGYEDEGYMQREGRNAQRDLHDGEPERPWDRNDFDRDREYGGRADYAGGDRGSWRGEAYGRDTGRRGDSTTGFNGGAYGEGDRYDTGGFGRGAYDGGGYMRGAYGSGYSGDYGAEAGYMGGGYMGGDYRREVSGDVSRRGQSYQRENAGQSTGQWRGDDDGPHFGREGGSSFRQNDYGDFNRGDYSRGMSGMDRGGAMGDEGRPSFRGRGPRGYQRSDERIREDVCERLAMDHYVDASEIDVRISAGVVTLDGSVSDRGQKRRAEDIAESVTGIKDVENNLRVERDRGSSRTDTAMQMAGSSSDAGTEKESGNSATGTTTSSNKTRSK